MGPRFKNEGGWLQCELGWKKTVHTTHAVLTLFPAFFGLGLFLALLSGLTDIHPILIVTSIFTAPASRAAFWQDNRRGKRVRGVGVAQIYMAGRDQRARGGSHFTYTDVKP